MPSLDANTTTWFLDQTSLIEELKRSQAAHRSRTPVIPGYDDMREISRGGQGVVYAALQRSTKRKVAIKVLLDGAFSSNAAKRRFEREIDLVAGLRHPNIVQVYDSGTTPPPDERLYFVMEFIDGSPLTSWAHGREVRDILALFAQICDAVNFAHQRGVIHRDLKPTNIRVDSTGRSHVLDFGLAKLGAGSAEGGAEGAAAREPSLTMSISGQFLGSLPWASPEQAEGATDRIDTRSDVYALGVVLYQVLTGRFPYDVEASFRDVLDNILTDEPLRPSTLNSRVDDEVETILLKCLAKDPDRRYQTAGELANDIRRYLAGEPIDAKRDSLWYTMRKRLVRYRLITGAAALLMLALIGGFGATLWQAHKTEQQRERADEERYRAEKRFNDVRALARTFIFEVNDQIADLAGSRPARELLVQTALKYLENLSSEASDDASLQSELAAAWERVGDIQGNPFVANLGNTAAALESYRRAHKIRAALAAAAPDDLEVQRLLAASHNQVGDMQTWMGEIPAALESYRQARGVLEPIRAAHPENARIRRELLAVAIKSSDALGTLQSLDQALAEGFIALELADGLHRETPESPLDIENLATVHSKLGYMLGQQGKSDEALEHIQTSLKLGEQMARAVPHNSRAQRSVEIGHNQVGAMLTARERFDEALEHFNAALTIAERMMAADANDALAASDLAFTLNKIADLKYRRSDVLGALPHYRRALEIREGLVAKDPNNASFLRDLAVSRSMVGTTYQTLGKDESRTIEQRIEDTKQAITWLEACHATFIDMRTRNILPERDAGLPDEIGKEIDASRESLKTLGG
jgi:tetratricopeptide (TPR) repeat protein